MNAYIDDSLLLLMIGFVIETYVIGKRMGNIGCRVCRAPPPIPVELEAI